MNRKKHINNSEQKACSVCRSRIEYTLGTLERCIGRYCERNDDGNSEKVNNLLEQTRHIMIDGNIAKSG